jgi:ABC-type multidrug transport system ATPase subunit
VEQLAPPAVLRSEAPANASSGLAKNLKSTDYVAAAASEEQFSVIGLSTVFLLAAAIVISPVILLSFAEPRTRFAGHIRALGCATVWRQCHGRALPMHIAQLGIPGIFMCMIYMLRNHLHNWIKDEDADMREALTSYMGGEMRIVEYAFCVALPYVAMFTMLTFVWRVSSEKETGFRRLLHISGVSRSSYIIATAGIEGILQGLIVLLMMLCFSAFVLHLRMVIWTSPVVLAMATTVLVTSAITLGYLLHFICRSERMASLVGKLIMTIVLSRVIALPGSNVVPLPGEQAYTTLALPPLPIARALFELSNACNNGRCLSFGDVERARYNASSPWLMISGAERADASMVVLTPPEGFLSLLGLVAIELLVFWALILFFDARYYPDLHEPKKIARSVIEKDEGLLIVRGLAHSYGFLSGQQVLQDVSFSIPSGGMLGMLGPNGSGKTTTIRCITGEEAASGGQIVIDTTSRGDSTRGFIGLCPQENVLNMDLTVAENLKFFALVRGASAGKEADACVSHILASICMEEKRHWFPDTLSGGMRRRLAVACAMIAKPYVVILDEPTTGLDPMSRRGIWSTIGEIKSSGGCCLLTTHMLEEAEALATNIVVLRKGTVVAEGTVQALKQAWGDGYLLSIDCEKGTDDEGKSTAKKFVASLLSEKDRTPIRTTEQGQLTFKLTCSGEALGHIIIKIAQGQQKNYVKHWGLSQASLEDTYLRIIEQPDAVAAAGSSKSDISEVF